MCTPSYKLTIRVRKQGCIAGHQKQNYTTEYREINIAEQSKRLIRNWKLSIKDTSTRTYTHTHSHIHAYTHTHVHTHMYACTHTHTCTHIHTVLHAASVWSIIILLFRVHSGQGKLEKSGKIRKRFPVTRKSGNVDYSPIVRESQGI